jgi:uncharacterized repeat protein (TIGR01451 family)
VSSSVNAGAATTEYQVTLFAANTNGNVGSFGGAVTSLGHNLSDDGTGNLTAPGDLPNTNPDLGFLGDNGGPTQTQPLLPGSPAIGHGSPVALASLTAPANAGAPQLQVSDATAFVPGMILFLGTEFVTIAPNGVNLAGKTLTLVSAVIANHAIGDNIFLATDQRGVIRPTSNPPDIGAYQTLPALDEEGPPSATAGSDLTYYITVTNDAQDVAPDVMLTNDIPVGTTFVSATQISGTPFNLNTPPVGSGPGTQLTAGSILLEPGQYAVFQLVLHVEGSNPQIADLPSVTGLVGVTSIPPAAVVLFPVTLTLFPATVADGSPPGSLVGIVTVSTPFVGQFLPLTTLDIAGAEFSLVRVAGEFYLTTNFTASLARQSIYLVSVSAGSPYVGEATFQITVVPFKAELVRMRAGRRKKTLLMVGVFDAGVERVFLSPFQAPRYKDIKVTVPNPDAPDPIIVTARRGMRTFTEAFPA